MKGTAPATPDLQVGERIDGRYVIQGVLGVGGFATVYQARQLLIERTVALKVLDLHKTAADPSFGERFIREAQIAARIRHPNVVRIHDFGFHGAHRLPYIAMEILEGRSLDQELALHGPMLPARLHHLFTPILDALAVGHRAGIIHKDLKPANLMLTNPGEQREALCVLDFGVARAESGGRLTETGRLFGTPRYLAPEYIQEQRVTPAIDVYQMALIIAEALQGLPVVDDDPYASMVQHCTGDLRLPDFLCQGAIGDVFKRALAVRVEDRFPDAGAFLQAFQTLGPRFQLAPALPGAYAMKDSGAYPNRQGPSSLDLTLDSAVVTDENFGVDTYDADDFDGEATQASSISALQDMATHFQHAPSPATAPALALGNAEKTVLARPQQPPQQPPQQFTTPQHAPPPVIDPPRPPSAPPAFAPPRPPPLQPTPPAAPNLPTRPLPSPPQLAPSHEDDSGEAFAWDSAQTLHPKPVSAYQPQPYQQQHFGFEQQEPIDIRAMLNTRLRRRKLLLTLIGAVAIANIVFVGWWLFGREDKGLRATKAPQVVQAKEGDAKHVGAMEPQRFVEWHFVSEPTGATVQIGGRLVCERTPCTTTVPYRQTPVMVHFVLEGYHAFAKSVVPDGDGTIDAILPALAQPKTPPP